jgi:hypothetical protein
VNSVMPRLRYQSGKCWWELCVNEKTGSHLTAMIE